MPNGLGAILAALAGGAGGYTNMKQREREEALEAAKLAREERDRQEQRAFQQFEMERELRKMGGRYIDEMGPDAPSLVKMDRVETVLPGTGTTVGGKPLPPLKIGITPMQAALGFEPDKERVRMARQATEVPGSGGRRVYLPTTDELGDQAFARMQRQGKIERAVIANENQDARNVEEGKVTNRLRTAGFSEKVIQGVLSGLKPGDVELSPDKKVDIQLQAARLAADKNSNMGRAIQDFMTKDPLRSPTASELQFFIDAYKMSSGGALPRDLGNLPFNPYYFPPLGSPK